MPKKVSEKIDSLEYSLAKLKFVQTTFPDATYSTHFSNKDVMYFSAKSANSIFTKYRFRKDSWSLVFMPYTEITFNYKGKDEVIEVSTSPKHNKLVSLSGRRHTDGRRIMKFHRFSFNMKKNNFNEEVFNACRAEIMKVIQDNPGFYLDKKHLEPRLKKLLAFT